MAELRYIESWLHVEDLAEHVLHGSDGRADGNRATQVLAQLGCSRQMIRMGLRF